ncbi:hypothetical protein [Providencia rettgeri]|uniref:hypothetical protein n=1 Tax=Providencia rettgeri TaxID=587 RepID=UPI00384E31FD
MMKNSKFSNGKILSCLLIIHALFFSSYIFLIGENFSYMGFKLIPDEFKIILSSISILLISIYVSFLRNDFLKITSILLFIFSTSPNLIIFSFMPSNWYIFTWSILCIPFTIFFMKILPIFKLPIINEKYKPPILLLLLIVLTLVVISSHGFSLNWHLFLLEDIYDVRLASRESSTTASVYAYFILAKVLCPIAVIYAIENKKYSFLFLSIIIITYLFMTTGHKSVYFTIFVLIGFSLGKNTYNAKIRILCIASIILFCLCRILTTLDFNTPESLFFRRLFFIPALLNIYYFEYFEDLKLLYSGSFMSWALDYPLNRPPANEIGAVYFGNEAMSANNGYLSDGFANLGSFGILITIIITSWVYKFFWRYNVSPKYFGLVFVTFYAFQGSGLTTALFTHGSLLLCILIPIFLRTNNKK